MKLESINSANFKKLSTKDMKNISGGDLWWGDRPTGKVITTVKEMSCPMEDCYIVQTRKEMEYVNFWGNVVPEKAKFVSDYS